MVTKANHSSGAAGWGINQTSGTSPVIIAFDTDSGGFRHNEPAPANDDTVYHHLVMQRKGDFVESYMDGAPVGNLSGATGVSVSNATYAMAVGARGVLSDGTGGSFPLDGRIDELWIFNQALTGAEILDLNATNTFVPPSPFVLGDFNDDGNVTTADFDIMTANWFTGGHALNSNGEVTDDGFVDLQDFKLFKEQLFQGPASAFSQAVPEPSAVVLLLLSVYACLVLRPRRATV